ncbi:hypothetical protein ACHAXS_013526 [Conticribra weissflogii]
MITVVISNSLDAAGHFKSIVFDENATASELIVIVLAFAILWYIIFAIVKAIIRTLVHNKPWLKQALERDYERSGKRMLEEIGLEFTKEEAIEFTMNDWPKMQAIYLQHLVGSMFCIPSLLGLTDPSTASSLAICGILSEMGWELQDMTEILYIRYCKKDGKKLMPGAIVFIFALHHSLTTSLGVPMILYYRNLKTLHWLCFDLQFAAALALMISEYTKLLDIANSHRQLRQFKTLNIVAFTVMLWTRVIHWIYLIFDMLVTFHNDKAWTFLVVGVLASLAFSLFSFLVCVKPFYKKLVKFHHASVEFESLPADATTSTRRSSVMKLEKAMADLLEEDEMKEVTDFVDRVFSNRNVSRRQTLQPMNRRRQSLMVMLAKCSKSEMNVLTEVGKKNL